MLDLLLLEKVFDILVIVCLVHITLLFSPCPPLLGTWSTYGGKL